MNRLSRDRQAQVVAALSRATRSVRLTGVAKNTVIKLLRDLGAACQQYQHDRLRAYLEAVDTAFADQIDYAMLVKLFGLAPEAARTRGRPHTVISGAPDPQHVSTSSIERQNLTMRMGMRRFTRKTNAFSKKLENLQHAVALHYGYYNFVRTTRRCACRRRSRPGWSADHGRSRIWSRCSILLKIIQTDPLPVRK